MRPARHSGVQLMCTLPASISLMDRTAADTSGEDAGAPAGTVPVTVPSNGEVTSSVRPLAAGCHVPPISISICTHQPVRRVGVDEQDTA